jgi:hypothetical protein
MHDQRRRLSEEDVILMKKELLYQFERLEKKGMKLPKKFTLASNLEEMRMEYDRLKRDKEVDASIKFQRRIIMATVSGVEWMNGKWDPLGAKLDGWSDSIYENINDYDDIFEELHEKYKGKAKIAPELKLMMMLGGSAFMHHMTHSMFKSQLPGLDEILRQNPDLAKNFKFPFGCPLSAIPPTDRSWKYAPSAEFGIALGASPNNNGSTLVYIPGKGLKPRERYDVSLLKVPVTTVSPPNAPMGADLPATSDSPVLFPSGFISSTNTVPTNTALTNGTLGMDLFSVDTAPENATKPSDGSVTSPVIPETLSQSHTQLVPHIPCQLTVPRTRSNFNTAGKGNLLCTPRVFVSTVRSSARA